MNGAESLVRTLIGAGVEVCFANPGTSEMHVVAALDRVGGMRPILALAEGVATGAADGYARMAGIPACTLLHLGPGLANGLANLHNARKAQVPVVNLVGDHAASHLVHDAPLTADVAGFARPVSAWIEAPATARAVAAAAARAVRAAREPPGQIATLILRADAAWDPAEAPAPALPPPAPAPVDGAAVDRAAALLRGARRAGLLLRGGALGEAALAAAGRIAAATGAVLLCDTFAPRVPRGAGRVAVARLPYRGEEATAVLAGLDLLLLVGAQPPVSFFAYPGRPGWLTPEGCRLATLAHPHEDGAAALDALAGALGGGPADTLPFAPPDAEGDGPLDAASILRAVARHLPEGAIVADESISSGMTGFAATSGAGPHDWLHLGGGAIGSMMAVATGAAVACPGRKVVNLQADGSALYILQALWTQARERLDVVTVIFANRAYRILEGELARVGGPAAGPVAASLISLDGPAVDWVRLAGGFGVEAVRTDTRAGFADAFRTAMRRPGPFLIEAAI